jgi:hypothetical protein
MRSASRASREAFSASSVQARGPLAGLELADGGRVQVAGVGELFLGQADPLAMITQVLGELLARGVAWCACIRLSRIADQRSTDSCGNYVGTTRSAFEALG